MSEWPVLPLGELTENFDGRRVPVKGNERKPGPYPYYGASGIVDRVDGYLFDGEYLLIGEDGENLRTRQTPIAFMAKGKFWVNNHAHIVRGNHRADTRFLSYVLSQTDIGGYLTGSTMPKLTQGNLNRVPVIAPPLAEQKAIAAVLGALDDKIELNRRMNATLEAIARAIFQSWFIDFDPVRWNLDHNQPSPQPSPTERGRSAAEGEGAPGLDFDPVRAKLDPASRDHPAGLDQATAALFPASFQDSPIGEIPQGWRNGTLGELVELRTDRVDATPAKDGKRYIALEDMPSKSIDISSHQLGSAVNSSITAFRKGDVLFGSMRPYFHKVGLAFFDGITRTTTFVLRPRKDCFRHFALLHFFSNDVVAYSTTASVGTTIPYVKWDSLESYRIPIPPDSLLAAFEQAVSPLVQRIAAQGEESRTLATLRDTLLPKLLSGELSVQGATN